MDEWIDEWLSGWMGAFHPVLALGKGLRYSHLCKENDKIFPAPLLE